MAEPRPRLPVSRARALDSLPHSGFQEEHELAWGRGKGIPGEETTFVKAQKHQRATVPFGAEKANLVKVVLQDSKDTVAVWQSRSASEQLGEHLQVAFLWPGRPVDRLASLCPVGCGVLLPPTPITVLITAGRVGIL